MTGLHFSKHAVAATRQGLNSDDKPMKGAGKKVASSSNLKFIFGVNDGDIAIADKTV